MFESPLFEGGAAMKRCLPLAAAGAMIVAACSETSTPTAPTPAPTPAFLAVQGEQHIHVMLPKPHPGATARLKTGARASSITADPSSIPPTWRRSIGPQPRFTMAVLCRG